MRLGIKGKQVLGVTAVVGVVVVVLSLMHLARLAQVSLDESRARAELLGNSIYHRAREVVMEGATDTYQALHDDPGLRSILEASLYDNNVTFAAIADAQGRAVVHADPSQEGRPVPVAADLEELLSHSAFRQLTAIYQDEGRNLDYAQPLLLNDQPIGSIHIGVSTLLVRSDLARSLRPAVVTALAALGVAVLVATVLAQLLLRPIHVIRSGLTRLGQGEAGVQLDLGQDEFGELGTFFNAVSAQIAADRSQMAGQVANLESAVERLEDAVAIVGPDERLLFANPAMRALVADAATGASLEALLPRQHPLRQLAEEALVSRQSRGPLSATFSVAAGEPVERLVLVHPVNDAAGGLVGVMLIARNVEYLSQIQSTIRYSRKLAALGRLSAGVAHEVKNPLNSMMIHLELLRQHVSPAVIAAGRSAAARGPLGINTGDVSGPPPEALQHVDVIAREIRRLDEVVQGFLKFTRPEDLKLQPVNVADLLDEVVPVVRPEAERRGVEIVLATVPTLEVNGDPGMLRQAVLNLALNACQAMPNGGTLRLSCEATRGRRVKLVVSDTGVGIQPEHLQRIFDLYFTTKPDGSGIGLSMVYRTVQMHDGEIEVQSTPGKGTAFSIVLPQA